jgi:Zn-dependent M16 (insulinase) family peptidase
MTTTHGFELLREAEAPELKSKVRLYRHVKTGAELLSIINEDDNKAFAVTFRTPPADSTGIAHILEHSVLCGSRKYPLKEPFIELVKGSLKTFLNAFTGSAETYYPVASVNTRDFYNLVDVYFDAVFHPRLTEHIFQQEGWHYELTGPDEPLIYKGIVFNEMKGAYGSPDTVLYDAAERSLFPDHVYGVSAGGDPKVIPDLTYEGLKSFHEKYYHPSNARIWFWGDDEPDERLRLSNEYLSEFEARPVDSLVPALPRWTEPRRLTQPYAVGAGADEAGQGMLSVNWVLTDDAVDFEVDLALDILKHILTGTAAAPLRKAMLESRLVEDLGAGVSDGRQRAWRTGFKGVDPANADQVEALMLDTLRKLADEGIDPDAVEAAMNTAEFSLRELNTGGFPRGLMVLFYAMSSWLYGRDPIAPLQFETPLTAIKEGVAKGGYFENLIREYFLDNPHRTTIVYTPDPGLAEREAAAERAKLETIKASLSTEELTAIVDETKYLQQLQQTPDTEEQLATLPRLTIADLDPKVKIVPTDVQTVSGVPVYYHDLFTNGIVYVDLGFDLKVLRQELLSYLPLFGRSLLEMGTEKEDFVQLTQRIGRKTGGVSQQLFTSSLRSAEGSAARLWVRAKATPAQAPDLTAILEDILLHVKLDNQDRFRQMATEEKVRLEAAVASSGHGFAGRRLAARFSESGWLGEQISGITYLFFIRQLLEKIDSDWPSVLASLEEIRSTVLRRSLAVANVTLDAANYAAFKPSLEELAQALPDGDAPAPAEWDLVAECLPEAFTVPGQVNYVAKAARLTDFGYEPSGSANVITNFLRTSWLWEKVRVEGGAYGGMCGFDSLSGVFSFLSYRDPNLIKTLENYDGSAAFLENLTLSDAELTRNIIGTISDLDSYQLPDAKGFSATARALIGETDALRQKRRDQVLTTTLADFQAFGKVLESLNESGQVAIVGSPEAIVAANNEMGGYWVRTTKVL